ncbi:MAG: acetolactate synthase small subunit [Micavibrio aeruginosavorus]|uniref:Acetolactate synthase small subunit n=1 Tax=Micavibrio aeruginosavorus TaxID=349221 RepID=A0A2W5PS52_9BACT|nr:MAG: acetolactate synthase small subunit [Micavibrio aeruginosavorus]
MVKKKQSADKSVYGTGPADAKIESHTLSVLVDNEPGVLAKVIGLFSGRGYNIESLTVAETDHTNNLSRITVICTGTPLVIVQIKNQLDRLVPVHRVTDLTEEGAHVERELALIKVAASGDKRLEALQTANIFRARVVDSTHDSFVFEVTGSSEKVNAFIDLMRGLGMIDVSRTGVAAMSRGAKAI